MIVGFIITTLVFVLLAGAFNGCMDLVADPTAFAKSRFPKDDEMFYLKTESWKNKWKNGDPKQGPKFFGSTTFLVFVTDFWHLMQFGHGTMWTLAILSAIFISPLPWWGYLLGFVVSKTSYSVGFHLTYTLIFRKNPKLLKP